MRSLVLFVFALVLLHTSNQCVLAETTYSPLRSFWSTSESLPNFLHLEVEIGDELQARLGSSGKDAGLMIRDQLAEGTDFIYFGNNDADALTVKFFDPVKQEVQTKVLTDKSGQPIIGQFYIKLFKGKDAVYCYSSDSRFVSAHTGVRKWVPRYVHPFQSEATNFGGAHSLSDLSVFTELVRTTRSDERLDVLFSDGAVENFFSSQAESSFRDVLWSQRGAPRLTRKSSIGNSILRTAQGDETWRNAGGFSSSFLKNDGTVLFSIGSVNKDLRVGLALSKAGVVSNSRLRWSVDIDYLRGIARVRSGGGTARFRYKKGQTIAFERLGDLVVLHINGEVAHYFTRRTAAPLYLGTALRQYGARVNRARVYSMESGIQVGSLASNGPEQQVFVSNRSVEGVDKVASDSLAKSVSVTSGLDKSSTTSAQKSVQSKSTDKGASIEPDWQPVEWTVLRGSEVSGDVLSKVSTVAGWNADAISQARMSGDGAFQFTATQADKHLMAGLGLSNDSGSWVDLEYALFLTATGQVQVRESGSVSLGGNLGAYEAGDVFEIRREGNEVSYWRNDSFLYTSERLSESEVLKVDTSLHTFGASLSDARWYGADQPDWQPVDWTDFVGTEERVSGTGIELAKVSTVNGWNSDAISQGRMSGDGAFQFTATQTDKHLMAGLSSSNDSSSWVDLEYALFLTATGLVQVREEGSVSLGGNLGAYEAGDVFEIRRLGNEVSYWKNETFLYQSERPSTNELLRVDVSLNTVGVSLSGARWYGAELPDWQPVAWMAFDGTEATAGQIGSQLSKISTTGGWNADAISQGRMFADGAFQFTAPENNKNLMAGLGVSNDSNSWTDLDYTFFLTASGVVQVRESGSVSLGGNLGTYKAGDVFEIRRVGRDVSYWKNGAFLYLSERLSEGEILRVDTSLNTVNVQINDARWYGAELPEWQPVEWTEFVGTEASDGQTGSQLSKVSTVGGWNADAISLGGMPGDGAFQFVASQPDKNVMAALGVSNDSSSWVDFEYGIFLTLTGRVQVRELGGGSLGGDLGTYAVGDVFEIRRIGSEVSYWRNDSWLYTSERLSENEVLRVDTSLNTVGADLRDARWYGSGVPDWQPVVWTEFSGTEESVGEIGSHLTKVSAVVGWNSDAISQGVMLADGGFQFVAAHSDRNLMAGLGVGNDSSSWVDLEYALFLTLAGQVQVRESGSASLGGNLGTYQAGDVFEIRRSGNVVTYWKNETFLYQSERLSIDEELRADTSLNSIGAAINDARCYFEYLSGPIEELDSDGDGISDQEEIDAGLDPNSSDSDGDGIDDFLEFSAQFADPLIDSDGDGVSDQVEILLGSDPDGDEFSDNQEVALATGLEVFTPNVQ